MKLHNFHRQTVDQALPVLGNIQPAEHNAANEIDRLCQIASPAVEAALTGQARKEISVFSPVAEHLGFHFPSATLADQDHRDQLTIAACRRRRPWSFEQRSDLQPDVVDNGVHPCAKIVEIGYHVSVLWCVLGG